MIAFKGFTQDLTASFGRGNKKYPVGEKVVEEKSKYSSCGMHCAEDPLYTVSYYPLGSGRYYMVEAAGSLDEDGSTTQIACTEMTLLKELTHKQLAGYGMMYMVQHPTRDWKKNYRTCMVRPDEAEGTGRNSIAIARGKNPRVRGKKGSVLGLIVEKKQGEITGAKVFEVDGAVREDTWYTLYRGKLKEVDA